MISDTPQCQNSIPSTPRKLRSFIPLKNWSLHSGSTPTLELERLQNGRPSRASTNHKFVTNVYHFWDMKGITHNFLPTHKVPIVKDLVGHKVCGLQRSGMGVAWRHHGSSPVVLIVAPLTWHWKHQLSSVSLVASCSDVFLLSIFSAQFWLIHRFENCGTFCFFLAAKKTGLQSW